MAVKIKKVDQMAHLGVAYQSSASEEEALARTAQAFGVESEYWDIFGRQHRAAPETLRAVLRSLGVDTSSRETLDRSFEQKLWDEWSRPLPPVLVTLISSHGKDQPPDPPPAELIPIHLPERFGRETVELLFEWEHGGSTVHAVSLEGKPPRARAVLRQQNFCRWEVAVPDSAPLGYHTLTLRLMGPEARSATMRLVVCPRRAWLPEALETGKAAGVAVGLFGLRSERNWGCGDFTDLAGLSGWVAGSLEAGFIALNPLTAIPNRIPYNTSPYSPNSIFYKNPIYLDIESIPEFQACERAHGILAGAKVRQEIAELRNAEFVDYERVYRLKLRFLKLLFRQFLAEIRQRSERARQFDAWRAEEGALLDGFALYCALDESIRRQYKDVWIWQDWPEPYRDPNSPGTKQFAKEHWRLVLFYQYVQWLADRQLKDAQEQARREGLSIGLYHDLALATDRCGADVWAGREYFVTGCRVGSPPDDFAPEGQDWGFPPPNALRHRQDGYRQVIESIRRNSRHGGALRIDHVMRFFRLYWIPDGMDAAHGTYVNDFYQDLVRILALESVRGRFLVVGEDLGTVPTLVRETLERYGILSYRLFYFEKHPDGAFRLPVEYPRQALVSTTTHDLPTLAGFWVNRDIEARRAAGVLGDEAAYHHQIDARRIEKQRILDVLHHLHFLPRSYPSKVEEVPEMTGEVHNAIIGFLASTPSKLLVINQEDLTKETEQQNLPGTVGQYPNWRRKMRFSLEQLDTEEAARDYTSMVRHWLSQTGRRNST